MKLNYNVSTNGYEIDGGGVGVNLQLPTGNVGNITIDGFSYHCASRRLSLECVVENVSFDF